MLMLEGLDKIHKKIMNHYKNILDNMQQHMVYAVDMRLSIMYLGLVCMCQSVPLNTRNRHTPRIGDVLFSNNF